MLKYFGTDGLRGRIGVSPITPEFIVKLGWALGSILPPSSSGKKVVIGKDTRISGYLFEAALQTGLFAASTNVLLTGPIPSPAVAYLTRTMHAQVGIVISASHNDNLDNGIKFFSADGSKISEDFEEAIEKQLDQPLVIKDVNTLGKGYRIHDAPGRYIEFCKSVITKQGHFDKLKIVIDCANGATYSIAPTVFTELGATVVTINASPDGLNINENCGSMHPSGLQKRVLKEKADLGLAFDGDGDRLIMVDHRGEVIDGDEMVYIIAKNLLETGRLSGGAVGTLMSNGGLELALQNLGIPFFRAPVGDQHVIQELKSRKWLIGGENSGHIIFLEINTTADGIISALLVLEAMLNSGKTLHEIKQGMVKFPQRIVNIPYTLPDLDLSHPALGIAIKSAEKELLPSGRIIVRFSGTEKVVRLMVEGADPRQVDVVIDQLTKTISQLMAS